MSLEYRSFTSHPSMNEARYPLFREQASIQTALEEICNAWVTYLENYVELTKEIFKKSEFPWDHTERAIVSTLSAAISRTFAHSLVIEERGVDKIGNDNGKGRCDLWATIPELQAASERFSFYLEAKRSRTPKTSGNLRSYLLTDRGVSRLFNDYLKAKHGKIGKLSPYHKLKGRVHPHYVIGLLVMPLERNPDDPSEDSCYSRVDDALHDVFDNTHHIKIRSRSEEARSERDRRLGRFPTKGLILAPQNEHTGMIAVFTVIGATQELLNKPKPNA